MSKPKPKPKTSVKKKTSAKHKPAAKPPTKKSPTKKVEKKKARKPDPEDEAGPQITGSVELADLEFVSPNDWNPNKLKGPKLEAVRLSMLEDGWLSSEALLIWGTDETGKLQNKIIDGEHRWKLAKELGYQQGPMVFLHGITRAKAIELTIKLDNNRGDFDRPLLIVALKELLPELDYADPAVALGFAQTDLNKLLGVDSVSPPAMNHTTSQNTASKTVPLFMDEPTHVKFMQAVKRIGEKCELETVTEVVLHCIEEVNDFTPDE